MLNFLPRLLSTFDFTKMFREDHATKARMEMLHPYPTILMDINTNVFNSSSHFYVLVQLMPRIYYHPEADLVDAYLLGNAQTRFRQEPVSITLAILVGAGVLVGVGTGTAGLITSQTKFDSLRYAMAQDLKVIEKSISRLEESLTSLSEVALQNRRGLDLLFLKEGGLCAALKEQCCFYIDHSGKSVMPWLNSGNEYQIEKKNIRHRKDDLKGGLRPGLIAPLGSLLCYQP